MAGIYSPKNVGKLIFGGALATETTAKTFRAGADIGEVQVLSADGTDAALGKKFKIVEKRSAKPNGIQVSDQIEVDKITKIVARKYAPAQNKIVVVSGFTGTPEANVTYRVSIRLYDHIQSPENFRHIHGFAVTGKTVGTYVDILDEIKANLDSTLKREYTSEDFTITVDSGAGTLTVTALDQEYVQGKNQGSQLLFEVETSVKENCPTDLCSNGTLNLLTVTTTQENDPGNGVGKNVANLEYFLNGYETTDYGREVGFPVNFNFSPKAVVGGEYNTLQIAFFSQRDSVNVERQHKELNIVFEESAGTTKVEQINAVLAKLRTVLGTASVPADLT